MRNSIFSFIIVGIALTATAFTANHFRTLDERRIMGEFHQDIVKRADLLESELKRTVYILEQWRDFYEVYDPANPVQFSAVAKKQLARLPSVSIIAWTPLVPVFLRESFEAKIRRWIPNFEMKEIQKFDLEIDSEEILKHQLSNWANSPLVPSSLRPASIRPIYTPVTAIEPKGFENAELLIGVDLMSAPFLRIGDSVTNSLSKGDITSLPGLPSPLGDEDNALVIIAPVKYDETNVISISGVPKGIILIVFSIGKILANSLLNDLPSGIHLSLVDNTGDSGIQLLYSTDEQEAKSNLEFRYDLQEFFGRKWIVKATPSADYIDENRSNTHMHISSYGIIATILFFIYFRFAQKQSTLVQTQVEERTQELNIANAKLELLSRLDPLTGVENKRCFNEKLMTEWNRAQRDNRELSLLLIDIDHFKPYNDNYGHLEGDKCLQQVAEHLKASFKRSSDSLARYGGEEFVVIMTESNESARKKANECCLGLRELSIPHEFSDAAPYVTASMGFSSVIPNADIYPELLLDCADRALYKAKENGRNRVSYYPCPTILK